MSQDLAAVLAEARARWPEITVDDAALSQRIAEHVEPTAALPPFAAELVLAGACLHGDEAAVRYFHHEMFARVDRVLARLRLGAADVDDIKQEVRAKLLLGGSKLGQYQGTGPLAQWVASVAGREALDLLRKRQPVSELEDDDLFDASDDPELHALKTRHRSDFKAAFQDAVSELEPRDRAILRALVVDDRTVNEIAVVYGIHRVTASRWVSEIRQSLLRGTRARLRESLKIDGASLDSAIRLIDSNLDVSLFRLLQAPA
ncbi:MAG: putative DNA-binding regulatory protein [Deltaproteobacteria bacterium]|nr:putative DNA-binding regulatory protein [Deltaproteobacteria bacterium]